MKYLGGTFSVPMSGDQKYRDNWEATFGKKKAPESPPEPCCKGSDNPAYWGHAGSCPFWDAVRPDP